MIEIPKWCAIFSIISYSLWLVSTLTKQIIIYFQKMNYFLKFEIIIFIIYYNILILVNFFRV
jgi:hypothetical protein